MKRIIQLIHPGIEYDIDPNNLNQYNYDHDHNIGFLYWNNGDHRRKFLRSTSNYIAKNDEKFIQQEVLFWGEWESHSNFTLLDNPTDDLTLPHHIHQPLYCMEKVGNQNTDPLVFGERFYYSNCQQKFKVMKNLDPGSIILFGTQIDKKRKITADTKFVIDTVFVVAKRIKYRIINRQILDLQDEKIPEILCDCTLNRLPDGKYSLYFGATKEGPKDGMFSYAPVKCSKENEKKGFEKVKFYTGQNHIKHDRKFFLEELKIIKQNLGVQAIDENTQELDFYNRLKTKILDQGFYLGHHFNYPDKRDQVLPI